MSVVDMRTKTAVPARKSTSDGRDWLPLVKWLEAHREQRMTVSASIAGVARNASPVGALEWLTVDDVHVRLRFSSGRVTVRLAALDGNTRINGGAVISTSSRSSGRAGRSSESRSRHRHDRVEHGGAFGRPPDPRMAFRRRLVLRAADNVHTPGTGAGAESETTSMTRANSVHYPGQNEPRQLDEKMCPVCRRRFVGGNARSVCCSPRCQRVRHREQHGDPTARATIKWLRDPPPCDGCGEPLHGTRHGAKYHDETCRSRARRRAERTGGES